MNSRDTPPDNPDFPDNLFRIGETDRARFDSFMREYGNPDPMIPPPDIVGEIETTFHNMGVRNRRATESTARREGMRRELSAFIKACEGLSLDTREAIHSYVTWNGVHTGEEWDARLKAMKDSASLILGWIQPKPEATRKKAKSGTPAHEVFLEGAAWSFIAAGFDRITVSNGGPFWCWLELLREICPEEITLSDYVAIVQRTTGKTEADRAAYVKKIQGIIRRKYP